MSDVVFRVCALCCVSSCVRFLLRSTSSFLVLASCSASKLVSVISICHNHGTMGCYFWMPPCSYVAALLSLFLQFLASVPGFNMFLDHCVEAIMFVFFRFCLACRCRHSLVEGRVNFVHLFVMCSMALPGCLCRCSCELQRQNACGFNGRMCAASMAECV